MISLPGDRRVRGTRAKERLPLCGTTTGHRGGQPDTGDEVRIGLRECPQEV
jgi:hypothetical protein